MRTLAILAFIAVVAAGAVYASQRPTIAHGSALAADLVHSNPTVLSSLDCDAEIPITVDGANFWCNAVFKRGPTRRLHFQLARTGSIKQIGEDRLPDGPGVTPEHIDKSDPWE